MKKKFLGNGLIVTGVAMLAASVGYYLKERNKDVNVCEEEVEVEEIETESELELEDEIQEIEEDNEVEEINK